MNRTFRLVILLIILSISLPACAHSALECVRLDVFCVGLVTDVGRINDKSVNQSAWEGLQQAEKDGTATQIEYIETANASDYDLNIDVFGDARYDVIVTVGSKMMDATLAGAAKYPDTYFIGVNQSLDTAQEIPPNLVGLTYPEDIAGYLAGALAAAMSTSHIVGAVCASDGVPSIWRFCEGFRSGTAYADLQLGNTTQVSVLYHNDVELDKAFTDPSWGSQTADSLIADGADVIFGAGGSTGSAALLQAAAKGGYGIGAEMDQYYLLPQAAPWLLSSAIDLESSGVTYLITKARDAENNAVDFPSGNFLWRAGLAPYHELDGRIPDNIKQMLNDLDAGLLNGSTLTNVPSVKP